MMHKHVKNLLSFFRSIIFPESVIKERLELSPNTEKDWLKLLPNSKEEMTKFLNIFLEAFDFPAKYAYKLHPNDHINVIYDQLYPFKSSPDALEHAHLFMRLEEEFKSVIPDDLNQTTSLFELFKLTQQTRHKN